MRFTVHELQTQQAYFAIRAMRAVEQELSAATLAVRTDDPGNDEVTLPLEEAELYAEFFASCCDRLERGFVNRAEFEHSSRAPDGVTRCDDPPAWDEGPLASALDADRRWLEVAIGEMKTRLAAIKKAAVQQELEERAAWESR
jgi:hypothetical protein